MTSLRHDQHESNYLQLSDILGKGSDCGTDGTRALPIDEETAWGAG